MPDDNFADYQALRAKLEKEVRAAACGFLRAGRGQALPRQWTTFALYLATNHKEPSGDAQKAR